MEPYVGRQKGVVETDPKKLMGLQQFIGILKEEHLQRQLCTNRMETVRGHHNPPPITPASSDSPRYIPPHKRPNHRQLLETDRSLTYVSDLRVQPTCPTYVPDLRVQPTCPTYVSGLRG